MFITTAGRTDEVMIKKAKQVALDLNVHYVPRMKQSIPKIQRVHQVDAIVVGKERLELYPFGEREPFFFHPNSSMFRIKRLIKGEHDPFIKATKLREGQSLLDCTLGLASDSIVASFAVGKKGKVVGIEGNPYLAYIVQNGLNHWKSGLLEMDEAMNGLHVRNSFALDYLIKMDDKSFDCVYFDPMFEESILESDGIKALSRFACYEDLNSETIQEAKRVARERVVLKDHFRSTRFEKYGFHVFKRKSAKFHFGVLDLT